MKKARNQFRLGIGCVLVIAIGCTSRDEQSFVLDNNFVKTQTGLDPSKIVVLTGAISSRVVDAGGKLERKEKWITITAVDGVALPVERDFCCEPLPKGINDDEVGDFFGNIWISSKGALIASEYAKSKGIPPYEELTMNAPDLRVRVEVRILGLAR